MKYWIYLKEEIKKSNDDIFFRTVKIIMIILFGYFSIIFIMFSFPFLVGNLINHFTKSKKYTCVNSKLNLEDDHYLNLVACKILISDVVTMVIFLCILCFDLFLTFCCITSRNFLNLKANLFHIIFYLCLMYFCEVFFINKIVIFLHIIMIMIFMISHNIKKIREKIVIIEDELEAQYEEVEHKKSDE